MVNKRLDSETWQRIEEIFLAVVDADLSQRESVLESLTGNDAALRAEVESLLAHDHDRTLPTIRRTTLVAEPRRKPGMLVSRYRLLYPLAITGSTEVWCAELVDESQRVAIKFMFDDSPSRQDRFENEAHLLARLRHPNIAEFLDCARDEEGHPFIVTRFVAGAPITEHADARQLTVDQRLELMSRVCDAIKYAHRFLIVHRDLKPANILVTDEGQPVVLDFGISKELSATEGQIALSLTSTQERPMTPAYASAEQVRGEPITTATDVHALGLVLYETISGHHPFSDAAQPEANHHFDRVCQSDPRFPSAVISHESRPLESASRTASQSAQLIAALRGATPKQLRRQLQGNVDAVTMKAIAKRPDDRYSSVNDFQNDLHGLIQRRPVSARVDRDLVRAAIRRQPIRSLAIGAAVAAGLAALVLSLFWSQRLSVERNVALAAQAEAAAQQRRATELQQQAAAGEQEFAQLESTVASLAKGGVTANDVALPDKLSLATTISLARNAAESGSVGLAQQSLVQIEAAGELSWDQRAKVAATYAALGRPTAGLRAMKDVQPEQLTRRFADPLDAQCTMIRLLLDAGQLNRADAWNDLNIPFEGTTHHGRRTLLMAESRWSIGWSEGANQILDPAVENPLRFGLSSEQLIEGRRLQAELAADANSDSIPLLEITNRQPANGPMAVVRAKALLSAAKLEMDNKNWQAAEAHLGNAKKNLSQFNLDDHFLSLAADFQWIVLADSRTDRNDSDRVKELSRKYWKHAASIQELGTVTAARVASFLMQQSDSPADVFSYLEQLSAYPESVTADDYVQRNLRNHEFTACLAMEQWQRAQTCIDAIQAKEPDLWGEDSLENTIAIAGQAYVNERTGMGQQADKQWKAVTSKTKILIKQLPPIPSRVFLVPVVEAIDSPFTPYEWLREYVMHRFNPLDDQAEMVAYNIESFVASHPQSAKKLILEALTTYDQQQEHFESFELRVLRLCQIAADIGEYETVRDRVESYQTHKDLSVQERALCCVVLGHERQGKRAAAFQFAKEGIAQFDQPQALPAMIWKIIGGLADETQRAQWKSLVP
jgi:serine/threonine protein kinase